MSSDPREAIALLRYRIVAAASDPRLTPAERGQLVRELAGQAFDHPDGSRYTYSRGTLDRWVRAYREQGLGGLRPPPRADLGTVRRHPELLDLLAVGTCRIGASCQARVSLTKARSVCRCAGIACPSPVGCCVRPRQLQHELARRRPIPWGRRRYDSSSNG